MSKPDRRLVWVAGLAALMAVGCRQDMHDAPRIDPLEANAFFADNQGARPIPAGTVARGYLRDDTRLYQGKDEAGALVDTLPMPLDRALLERGRSRYEIFCSPCHDSTGSGSGMIVRRGFTQPESYHTERLRAMPVGYFYDVMTNGFGVMSSYAAQVPVEDRWAIAAYIRALQVSQATPLDAAEVERQIQAQHAGDDEHGDGHDQNPYRNDTPNGPASGPIDRTVPGYGMSLPLDSGGANTEHEPADPLDTHEAQDDAH